MNAKRKQGMHNKMKNGAEKATKQARDSGIACIHEFGNAPNEGKEQRITIKNMIVRMS